MTDAETTGPQATEAPKLDDLMLAMDVVDTLRHQETLVERELGQEGRDVVLKERLREIYEGQGLEVSDRVLNQGIAALKESRFVYTPRGRGFARFLAHLWVRRNPIGIGLVAVLILALLLGGWSAWQSTTTERAAAEAAIELNETLPAELATVGQSVLSEIKDDSALEYVVALISDGEAALAQGDAEGTRVVIGRLKTLRDELVREYEIRIVSRPGEGSAVFRIPDVNESARNYYLIVEAVTSVGEVLTLPITSEEDGTTVAVAKWAVRVPKATYDAVAADKTADGIVDDNRLGEKPRGTLTETYLMPVEDGRIRQW